jgi:hypothetical protein
MSQSVIDRFKKPFLGTLAQRELPLLAQRIQIPDSVKDSDVVQNLLDAFDKKLDQEVDTALQGRTGTKVPIIGKVIKRDRGSSLKKVERSVTGQIDTDKLEAVTSGKGVNEVRQVITNLKDFEKRLQKGVNDELMKRITSAKTPREQADGLQAAWGFVSQKDVTVDGGKDQYVLRLGECIAKMIGVTFKKLTEMNENDFRGVCCERILTPRNVKRRNARQTSPRSRFST